MDLTRFSKASVFLFIVVAVLAGSMAQAQLADEIPRQDPSGVEIDSELESKFQKQGIFSFFSRQETEKVEFMVSLDRYPSNVTSVQGMKERASISQTPIMKLAEKNPEVELKNSFWITNAVLLEAETSLPLERIAEVQGVKRIHSNTDVSILQSPVEASDSGVSTQNTGNTYGLDQINTTETWNEFGTQGENVSVAVLDTGVQKNHTDIDITDENWKDFIYDNQSAVDHQYHGTHVSGTVVGGGGSGTNIGVAPGATLMHGAVLDKDGGGSFNGILNGIEWAVEKNADILSMSLGIQGGGYEPGYIDAIRNAEGNGTVVIAASGNDGEGTSSSPANVYEALAVGASGQSYGITDFSSGEEVDTSEDWTDAPSSWPENYIVPDVSAPGVDVLSSIPEYCDEEGCYQYGYLNGTSMATPHVSGAAALMESATNADLTPNQIKEALSETAWKPDSWDESNAMSSIGGNDTRYGAGIIDAYAATEYAVNNFDKGFDIRNVQLNQSKVNLTEPFKVTGDVENFEDSSKDVDLNLTFNGSLDDSQTLSVAAGSTESFEFESSIDQEGLYSVKVNEESAGELEVLMPPPNFSITSTLQDSEIVEGEQALVNGTVTNEGGDGVADLRLVSNGAEIASQNLVVDFESSRDYNFTESFDSPGDYGLKVNETDSGLLTVLKAAELRINSIGFDPSSPVFENESANISVEAENIGEVDGEFDIELFSNGTKINESTGVSVDSGSVKTVNFTESFDRGNYSISSGSASNELEVLRPGSVEIVDTALINSQVVEGDEAEFEASLENPGDTFASDGLEFKVNGSVEDTRDISLEPGTENVSFSRVFDQPGDYGLRVNDSGEKVLTVLKAAELNQSGLYVESGVEGEEFELSSEVQNVGEVSGEFNVSMNISGSENYNLSQELELGPGEKVNVTFDQVIGTPGDYVAESINRSAGFDVLKAANFTVENTSFSPSTIFTGQEIEIEALINNTGEVSGNATLNFSAGPNVTVIEEELDPGETSVNQSLRVFDSGNFTVSVNETTALNESDEPDVFEVKKPFVNITDAEGNVSDRGLVTVNASLNNTDPGWTTAVLGMEFSNSEEGISWELTDRPEFDLGPDEEKNISFETEFNFAGRYNYSLNSTDLGEFELNTSAEFQDLEPDNKAFDEGSDVDFSGMLDIISRPGEDNVSIEVDGEEVFRKSVSPGENRFEFADSFEPGVYEWRAVAELGNSTFESGMNSFEVEEASSDSGSGGGEGSDDGGTEGGAGGGAGGAAAFSDPEIQVEESSERIYVYNIYEAQDLSFNETSLPVKSLEFGSEPDNGTVTFEASSTENESVSFEKVVDASASFEGPFRLEVAVSRGWMEENRFESGELSVYSAGDFRDLDAELISEDDEEAVYRFELQDLSGFGIGSDQACYSMDSVNASAGDSCQVYDNLCDVPDQGEVVDSCSDWDERKQIEERITRARERDLSPEQAERLDEASEVLEQGDSRQAENILSEVENSTETNWAAMILEVSAVFAGISLLGFVGLKLYRVKRKKRMLSKVGELADMLKDLKEEGQNVEEPSIKLKQANQALKHEDYEAAGEIMREVREELEAEL